MANNGTLDVDMATMPFASRLTQKPVQQDLSKEPPPNKNMFDSVDDNDADGDR